LLWKPQDERLLKPYENAIEIIQKSKSPTNIYTEDRLNEYTSYTATELHKKDVGNENNEEVDDNDLPF